MLCWGLPREPPAGFGESLLSRDSVFASLRVSRGFLFVCFLLCLLGNAINKILKNILLSNILLILLRCHSGCVDYHDTTNRSLPHQSKLKNRTPAGAEMSKYLHPLNFKRSQNSTFQWLTIGFTKCPTCPRKYASPYHVTVMFWILISVLFLCFLTPSLKNKGVNPKIQLHILPQNIQLA